MIRILALMAVGFGLMPLTALAQAPDDGFGAPAFQSFLGSEFADRLRREALQRSIGLHEPGCVEPIDFAVTDTWPVAPVAIGEGDIAPTEGMWRERLAVSVCEEPVIENLVHTFTADGQRTFLLVRGRTEASLPTQLALINDARDVASGDDNGLGCDIIRFTDTHVVTRYGDGRWLERWNADACGEDVDLDILFVPTLDAEPTYSISAAR